MLFPNIKLSEINNEFSYYEIKTEKKKYDGSYIEIKKNDKEVSIEVDIFSRIPFYYYVTKNKIFGNSCFIELVKELHSINLPLSFDYVSIAAFLKNNCFLENSTYFKEILRVPPASKLIFNYANGSIKIQEYYNFQNENLIGTDKELSKDYLGILKENFKSYIETNKIKKIGISLTGGYDSRMILSILDNIKASVVAFHYGHKRSNDFKISKKICEKYNLDSKIIEWQDLNYFKINSNKILEESDFMLPIHHCHVHEIITDQIKTVGTVFYGHFMDMQMQSHFYNKNFDSEKSQIKVFKLLKNMWCGEPSALSVLSIKIFKNIFSKEIIESYSSKIDSMLKKYAYLDSDKQYEISYLLNHGTRRAIAQCQLASKKIDYYIPALQRNAFEFIWNLNTKTKKKRSFQKYIFKNIYKKSTQVDFVLDNYKIRNLSKDNFFNKNLEKIIDILKNPRIKILPTYFDFWGKEYQKFDNYKSWMIDYILSHQGILDDKIINKKVFVLIKNNPDTLPFAFISSFFTIINFFLFLKKLD